MLHLEGEANTWWFSYWNHAKLSTLVDFSQRMIRIFGQRREEPSPLVEEAYTSAVIVMEEKPSTSVVEGANTLKERTLATMQGVPKVQQDMIAFPLSIIATNLSEDCGNMLFYDPRS